MDILEQVEKLLEETGADAPALEAWQIKLLLTDLLATPVKEFRLAQTAGRFALLEYEPVDAPDPDIVLMLAGDAASLYNAAALQLQRHREERYLPAAQWYAQARRLLRHIEARLARVQASEAERQFALAWAADVVSGYRLLPPARTQVWM